MAEGATLFRPTGLFGRGGAAVDQLITTYGTREAAMAKLQGAAQSIATSAYETNSWVTIKVGDIAVSIKGIVIDGLFRISSIAKKSFER